MVKKDELRPIMVRIPEKLRKRIEREAAKSDRSMNAEMNARLERSFDAEDVIKDARRLYAEASAAKDAARVQAIRQAGFNIVREHGNVTVNVSADLLLAEADGISRSGFVAAENVNRSPTEIAIENAVARALEKAGLTRKDSTE
jgi:hypothetical protein